MKKALILLAAAAALAVPAFAQIRIMTPVTPQVHQVQPTTSTPLNFDPALDPDRARALISKLQAKNRDLRNQMTVTLSDLQRVRTELDEITRAGGTLVRAQCVSPTLSRRTDGGGEEDCSASGYVCGSVEGTCYRQCTVSTQCAGGFVCDTGANRCVVPPTGD